MRYHFNGMLTNGALARELGVDPKTLRKWAKDGAVPSYVNPANRYRYFVKEEVLSALRLDTRNSS